MPTVKRSRGGLAPLAALLLLILAAPPADAQNRPAAPPATPAAPSPPSPPVAAPPARVETRHTLTLGQRTLDYRAIAETIALHDQKGAETASVFTISYLLDPKPGQPRPVAFFFNGGPGAASVYLHLGAAGPRIMQTDANGAVPTPPVQLVDNPSTWLEFTDLVFVDPVGTGFSRAQNKPDAKDENPNKPFYAVHADIESLDAVVRLWLTKQERWASPVYLVGESYGGFRVGAMAKSLAHELGIVPSGIVMVSPALDMSFGNPDVIAQLGAALRLPTYAATAAALAGNPNFDAAPVEHFALTDYLVGLANMKGVPAANDPLVAKIAQITGLSVDLVRRERGWIRAGLFAHELRRDHDQVLSLYDATMTRPAPGNPWDDSAGDPMLDNATAAFTAAFNTYAPDGLGYHTNLPYRVLPRDVGHQWNWDGARGGDDSLGLALAGLQTALLEHPGTKVLIVNGRYDLVTPYFASRWLVDQLALPAAVRETIRIKIYEGGHMMYFRPKSREALAADAADLFAAPGN
jgi:carboxypeptidase C (cathepsin A)